jgi:hypothetical protein
MLSSLPSLMSAFRLAPHHIVALTSGLTIAATVLLFFILDYSSYGACMLAGYAAIILVHAFYLTDYAAAWPREPYFSNEKTRSTYFGAVKYAFYGACSLGPFLMDKEFPGLPILVARSAVKALVAVQLAASLAALYHITLMFAPEDALVCGWAHNARCARCDRVAEGARMESRPLALPLQIILALLALAFIPLSMPVGSLIKTSAAAENDLLVRYGARALLTCETLYHIFPVILYTRVSYINWRRPDTPPWPATPYLPGPRSRSLNVRGLALLCFVHAFLLPAFVDAGVEYELVLRWTALTVVIGAWGVSAWVIAREENRGQCLAEGHRWKCTRVFCPVYGQYRKKGSGVPADLEVRISPRLSPMHD